MQNEAFKLPGTRQACRATSVTGLAHIGESSSVDSEVLHMHALTGQTELHQVILHSQGARLPTHTDRQTDTHMHTQSSGKV
eukprot:scaffold27823_cov21-Tisochrysis_lutea.AAC.4